MDARARKGAEIVVVGGGAIGLAVARGLAQAGRDVLVLERAEPGGQATAAAGGMLSPLAESDGPGAFLTLGLESLALWPAFAGALTAESGCELDLRLDGKLLLALDDASVERLRTRHGWMTAAGYHARWLEGEALRAREPAATPDARAGLEVEQDGQVDNRALGRALARAVERSGVEVRRDPARAVAARSGRVHAVRTEAGHELGCDTIVLASGAWSGALEGLPRPLPVRPVKGQMVALAAELAPLHTVVETAACYLIPRAGARASVWVGATSEEAGFRRGVTTAGRTALREAAARAAPALARADELEAWDGFRPGTPDGMPVLGADPELGGLVHATGHFRNGILLTPITADLIVRAVQGHADARLAPFRPERFGGG